MKDKVLTHVEEKLYQYFKSIIIKESLKQKLDMLYRHKKEIEADIQDGCGELSSIKSINANIYKTRQNLRDIEKEFTDLEITLNSLDERRRSILVARYRDKRSFHDMSSICFLSESRLYEIRRDLLYYLHEKLNA